MLKWPQLLSSNERFLLIQGSCTFSFILDIGIALYSVTYLFFLNSLTCQTTLSTIRRSERFLIVGHLCMLKAHQIQFDCTVEFQSLHCEKTYRKLASNFESYWVVTSCPALPFILLLLWRLQNSTSSRLNGTVSHGRFRDQFSIGFYSLQLAGLLLREHNSRQTILRWLKFLAFVPRCSLSVQRATDGIWRETGSKEHRERNCPPYLSHPTSPNAYANGATTWGSIFLKNLLDLSLIRDEVSMLLGQWGKRSIKSSRKKGNQFHCQSRRVWLLQKLWMK